MYRFGFDLVRSQQSNFWGCIFIFYCLYLFIVLHQAFTNSLFSFYFIFVFVSILLCSFMFLYVGLFCLICFLYPCCIYPLSSIPYPLSFILYHLSSILYPLLSILYPLSSLISPLSSIIYPLSSIIYPLSSILYYLFSHVSTRVVRWLGLVISLTHQIERKIFTLHF